MDLYDAGPVHYRTAVHCFAGTMEFAIGSLPSNLSVDRHGNRFVSVWSIARPPLVNASVACGLARLCCEPLVCAGSASRRAVLAGYERRVLDSFFASRRERRPYNVGDRPAASTLCYQGLLCIR